MKLDYLNIQGIEKICLLELQQIVDLQNTYKATERQINNILPHN